ncbi:Protein of unknown function [Bacillus mycoides]|nr:Protein of unknown function [Bacillus mycoides]
MSLDLLLQLLTGESLNILVPVNAFAGTESAIQCHDQSRFSSGAYSSN